MLGQTGDDREGALARRLKDSAYGGKSGRMGFVTGGDGGKRRAMVVVARATIGPKLAGEIKALAEAGADAVELVGDLPAGGLGAAGEGLTVPCGLYVSGDSTGSLTTDGLDWIHVGVTAPARYLMTAGVTRVVEVPPDMAPGRVTGLAGLKAEVIAVDVANAGGGLTIDTLMALGTIQTATKKPVLASTELGLAPDDIAVLHEHGVDGVIVTGGADAVQAYVAAIERL